jgi:hypothetical protein
MTPNNPFFIAHARDLISAELLRPLIHNEADFRAEYGRIEAITKRPESLLQG